jgi:hypothetical protein
VDPFPQHVRDGVVVLKPEDLRVGVHVDRVEMLGYPSGGSFAEILLVRRVAIKQHAPESENAAALPSPAQCRRKLPRGPVGQVIDQQDVRCVVAEENLDKFGPQGKEAFHRETLPGGRMRSRGQVVI